MRKGEVVADRFEIERLAASGGMGSVYRARDRHTDGLAAVKIVQPAGADAVERFAREARALSELRHPGIVTYLGHGRAAGGELYLAMEWLDGEDLASRLATANLSTADTVSIAVQAAAALAAAHARDIVHRDLKPSNLFLVDWQPGRLKLLDFGVARLARLAPLTATGLMVGTPLYMPPEQARGTRRVDARADVFGLGAVIFQCLTGAPPFPASTAAELVARLLSDEEAVPIDGIPPELGGLVARMLRKDAAARPRDGAGVLEELLALDSGTARTLPRPLRGELTEAEDALQCVVFVAGPIDEALAGAQGGAVEPPYVVFRGGLPTDRAQRAARFALAAGGRAAIAVGYGGRREEALAEGQAAAEGIASLKSPRASCAALMVLGLLVYAAGRVDEAEEILRLALLLIRRGDARGGLELARRAETLGPSFAMGGDVVLSLALAEAHLALGDVDEARRVAREARATIERAGAVFFPDPALRQAGAGTPIQEMMVLAERLEATR